jgi:murein DD-endopeptidase MepM/ murein hydrolase activator NlpD
VKRPASLLLLLPALALGACAVVATTPTMLVGDKVAPVRATVLPSVASQGALVIGSTHPAATVRIDGRDVRVAPDGSFVFGIGRDAKGRVVVSVRQPGASAIEHRIAITPRDWPIERIAGVPPETVNPPPAIAARIAREQALVAAARHRDDAREDYAQAFIRPVQGRISGRFGNQRIYMLPDGSGSPKSPHSGMDIAAEQGTPVLAPAAGVVTFAAPDLYLTGGTVLLDHGHGVSSNFLHLSRLDVKVGDRVEQGQVLGAVGMTGRATGPHLHWGMYWFVVRVDPLLVLEAARAK